MLNRKAWRRRVVPALMWVGSISVSVVCCGEPLAPAANSWRREAEFEEAPGKIAGLAVTADGVYVALTRYTEARELAIMVYRGGRFEDEWVLPDAGFDGLMGRIGSVGTTLWAGGGRTEGEEELVYSPVLVRNAGSGWREVPLGASPGFGGVSRVYPVSEDACWLLTSEDRPKKWYGSLVLYENGVCRPFPEFPYVTAAYDADNRTLFVIPSRRGADVEVAITRDGGSSWVYEKAELEAFPGADLANADILPPVVYRNELFFAVRPTYRESWTAIYRRSGAPGAGEYELAFFSNLGPYFRFPEDWAADASPRLMVVGVDTCVSFDGTDWILEERPYAHTSFQAVAAGDVGFYATARNENTERFELLFHP